MSRFLRWCALVALFGSPAVVLAGDNVWTASGPDGGRVRQIVADPVLADTVYIAGDGGVWKSQDAGAHWTAARAGITELTIAAVAVDPTNPQVVYAGSLLGGGVFKSIDGGASWTRSVSGLFSTTVASLAVDPQNPANVYAGAACCGGTGVYKSSNAGATWSLQPGLPESTVSAIVIDPANASTIYAGLQSQGVWKSVNGGATWTAANAGMANSGGGFNTLNSLAIDPVATSTLYAATGGAIYKTTNGGASWVPTNGTLNNPGVSSIAINPQAPSTVFIGTTFTGVQRSVDGGASWTRVDPGFGSAITGLAIDPRNPARVYAGTAIGVFASADGGAAWAASNAGLANQTVQALAVDHTASMTAYAGTASRGVYKTVDGGATWLAANGGMTAGNGGFDVRALAIDPAAATTVYAGTGAGMFKSVDGGGTWTPINHGTLISNISGIVVTPPSTVRVSTFFTGVYLSTNGGDTWTTDNAGLPATPSVNDLAGGGGSLVAATPSGGTFARSDNGWQPLLGVPPSEQFQSLAYLGTTMSLAVAQAQPEATGEAWYGGGTLYFGALSQLLFVVPVRYGITPLALTFAPNTWSPLPPPTGVDPATCPPITAIVAAPTAGSFYAGGACGVLAVSNTFQTVAAMNAGLPPSLQVNALGIDASGAQLYAGTAGGGVFRYTKISTDPVTVVEYYNASLDHYFITWVPAEQANLDAGNTPTRWTRTNLSFKTYTTPQTGTSPVCRYLIPPPLGDSHFFGRGTQECAATGQNHPSFTLESPDFMQMFLPQAGTCPAGTVPVYRVFSGRPDANHRYTTDRAVRDLMASRGWQIEGDGPDSVVMCAPP